jgi:cytochrome P450
MNRDPRHWHDPDSFNPNRYLQAPRSDQVDESRCQQAGLARCPFSAHSAPMRDGRDGVMTNSGYGTVYGIVDGRHYPVVDHAGYAPFGFGYRRCPGEHLNVDVFKDVLRRVWRDNIEFVRLPPDRPERLPVGPGITITDDIGFIRQG